MKKFTNNPIGDFSRRDILLSLAAVGVAGCQTTPLGIPAQTRLAVPVNFDPSRVVGPIVGLRPGRAGGFRLDIERNVGKAIVHNYGHGGDGYTLSWPCAKWTADQISATLPKSVAILGAGVSGLTTAWILVKRGVPVTIYADKSPPHTTSNIAGAIILTAPTYRSGDNALAGPSDTEINAQIYDGLLPFVGDPRYAVYWVDHIQMSHASADPQDRGDVFLGRRVTSKFRTIMIDPSLYLAAMISDLTGMGAKLYTKKFENIGQLARLPEPVIANCTGLGTKHLFDDEKMLPYRGQLTLLKAQPEIDYSYICHDPGGVLYMFPRREHIVLGGTHERGVGTLDPNPLEVQRQLTGHQQLIDKLSGVPIVDS